MHTSIEKHKITGKDQNQNKPPAPGEQYSIKHKKKVSF